MKTTFSTNGKLLLTGEYFVLDGALALATPVRYGQKFIIEEKDNLNGLTWESYDHQGAKWFEAQFEFHPFGILQSTNTPTAERLIQIFKALDALHAGTSLFRNGLKIQSYLDFPNNWGLGSSSTLIAALAQWAKVDPYQLLAKTFGGSGYDLACAVSGSPILYQIQETQNQFVQVPFFPDFHEQLYFVFLNQKQNSRTGIQRYRKHVNPNQQDQRLVSQMTLDLLQAKDLKQFKNVMSAHENFISKKLKLPKVKDQLFPDYWGAVKSLGAWGGDFVMATSAKNRETTEDYFKKKGLEVVIPFADMIVEVLN